MNKIKDNVYYWMVSKNANISKEYERYVGEHIAEHDSKRVQHWWILIRLNWHYRILRKKTPLLYQALHSHPKTPNIRKPYIAGPESERYKRESESTLANTLRAYDVISFDIFDTLVLRPFSQPQDVFMILGYKFGIMDFLDIRKRAEIEARELRKECFGDTEITIYDIYARIHEKTGLDIEFGVSTEFETELEFCFANPYMIRVFKMLKAQKKKILAISDMYLPKPFIEKILLKCGYSGFTDIFISCDYRMNKREGELYDIVKNIVGENFKYAHVGDNLVSDINSARERNIDAFYYKNVHELGNPFRCDGMSELVGGAYRGIINTHLYNGTHIYSIPYEYGYVYGGLYVLGYCHWIHEYVKIHNIDKVLFLSRDGDIYQKVFNNLYDDTDNEYVYWSRIANLKYASEKYKDDFIKRSVIHRSMNVIKTTTGSLLESLELTFLLNQLPEYNLSAESLVVKDNVDSLVQLFTDHWEEVVLHLENNLPIVKEYISGIIKDCHRIAIVDVGWQGSGPLGIKYLIKDKWHIDCDVDCLVAASRIFTHNGNLHTLMDQEVVPYMFSRMMNRNLYDTHANTNRNTNNIYFELFTQATYPSFAGWNSDGCYLYEVPEVENYGIIKEIHDGIMDFCTQYSVTFKNYPLMLNISGYDAYLPYRFIIRDISYFKKYFGNFKYSRNVFADEENQNFETLEEIMTLANV